ncbi:Bug family tripartite tricarboxylate transporter substrate binding protein [Bordetella sp. H567]|uniref:Bug family tripartite tricarboxylate transporter substrate binding protein n=1 Tax=Bordetella sp. H567 TaxID=1697043 RepID=UPI0009F4B710|nr:tripartite tricarboxylate transporter substrate binding protein [Bordetella sp. H567]
MQTCETRMRLGGRHRAARNAAAAMLAAALALGARSADAQGWPTHAVTVVTPLAAGSAADVAIRVVTDRLSESLGQSMIVDNQTGASGAIGADRVARAAPDGYTLCGCNNTILGVLPNVRKVPYDPVASFRPIGMVAVLPTLLLVNPNLPVHDVKELIAYVKAHPGKVTYSTGGVGSPQHIAMAMFESAAGLQMRHIPYKGASQAAVGLAAGEVDAMFCAVGTVLPLTKSGKLRAIAVAGAQRTPLLPELPTVAEAGVPGYDYASWIGLVAPKGVPDAVVDKVSTQLRALLQDPATLKRFADQGIDPMFMGPEEMARYMAQDYQRMAKVVHESHMVEQ